MLPLRSQTFQDDWAYIKTVYNFLQTGVLRINEWTATSLVFQVYWGALFAKIFGFSPKILHLSTLTLFYFGTIFFYLLLKKLTLSSNRSLVFTLIYFFSPWVMQFAYSFLSDVPFISLLIISLYFYVSGLNSKNNFELALGSLFAGFAALVRQLGATIPMAILIIFIYKFLIDKKFTLKNYLAALTPFLIIYYLYSQWLAIPGNLTISQYYSTLPGLKKKVFPYLLPINMVGLTSATQTYYGEFIKKGVSNVFYLTAFTTPALLIFQINFVKVISFFRKYTKAIFLTYAIFGLFFAIEVIFHPSRKTYYLYYPYVLTFYDQITPFDWARGWYVVSYLSAILWLPLFGAASNDILKEVLKKIKPHKKTFLLLSFFTLLSYLLYYSKAYIKSIKPYVPAMGGTWEHLKSYYLMFGEHEALVKEIFGNSWITLLFPSLIILLLIYLLTHYKLNLTGQKNYPVLFLSLGFLLQFTIITVIMYFFFAQYMIANIPYLIIFLALTTKNWKINPLLTVFTISVFAIYSTSLTKLRYQNLGIQWGLAQELIEQGIKPANISVGDESWMRWAYGEPTLAEAIKKVGGDKYLITTTNTWLSVEPDPNQRIISFHEVPLDFKNEDKPEWDIFIDSGSTYWSPFRKTRFVAFDFKPEFVKGN